MSTVDDMLDGTKEKCDYALKDDYEKCRTRCYINCGRINADCPYQDAKVSSNGTNICTYKEKNEYKKCKTKDYTQCACQDTNCPYTKEALEQKKKEKKILVVNKADIKRSKVGKFSMEVWPAMMEKSKAETKDEVVIETNEDVDDEADMDVEFEVGEGHMIRRLRELDGIKTWTFIGKDSEEVYSEVMDYVKELIEDSVWNISGDNKQRWEMIRRRMSKSVNRAIRKKKWSFRKLEDIIEGHQFFIEEEKDALKEDIIMQVRDYLESFIDEVPKSDEEKEAMTKVKEWTYGESLTHEEKVEIAEKCRETLRKENEPITDINDERKAIQDEMKREQTEEDEEYHRDAEYLRQWQENERKRRGKQKILDAFGEPVDENNNYYDDYPEKGRAEDFDETMA